MELNKHILEVASQEFGNFEIKGHEDNPAIMKYWEAVDYVAKDDDVAWCSAAMNWVLKVVALRTCTEFQGTSKANARSFLKVGTEVKDPKAGDVVIFWRGSKDGWKGHVGVFLEKDENAVRCLGGNQANKFCVSSYDVNRVLGFRRFYSKN